MRTLGAFQVKTHLSQILKEIEIKRETIAITKHGHIIAIISPAPQKTSPVALAIESIKKNRRGVTLGKISLKKLIEEGRR